jgi:hypothetical protein
MAQYTLDLTGTPYAGQTLTGRLGYTIYAAPPVVATLWIDHSLEADAGLDLAIEAACALVDRLDDTVDALALGVYGGYNAVAVTRYLPLAPYLGPVGEDEENHPVRWDPVAVKAMLRGSSFGERIFHDLLSPTVGETTWFPQTIGDIVTVLRQTELGPTAAFKALDIFLQSGSALGHTGEVPALTGEYDLAYRAWAASGGAGNVLTIGTPTDDVADYVTALVRSGRGRQRTITSLDDLDALATWDYAHSGAVLANWTTDGITAGETTDTYTVEIPDGAFDDARLRVEWTVRADTGPAPTIADFSASLGFLTEGQPVTITWATADATEVTLTRSDTDEAVTLAADGTLTLTPSGVPSTTLTLTAAGATDPDAVDTLTLTLAPQPLLLAFGVQGDPAGITRQLSPAGDLTVGVPLRAAVTAQWSVTGAASLTLTPGGAQTITAGAASGTLAYTASTVGHTQTLVIAAIGRYGATETHTITLRTIAVPIDEDAELPDEETQEPKYGYVSLAQATDYFAARLGADAWTEASEASRIAALLTATKAIDRQRYTGAKTVAAQALAFPRTGLTDHERLAVATDVVPQDVQDAQCEEALARLVLLSYEAQLSAAQATALTGVKREKLGDAEREYFDPSKNPAALHRPEMLAEPALISPVAIRLLSPYFLRIPTKVW